MLRVEKLVKSYGPKTVVDNISFSVEKGSVFALLGANGAGKTTTFRMILGTIEPQSGSITYEGNVLSFSDHKKFGYLPEERSLLLKFTIAQQIRYFAELKHADMKKTEERMNYYLKTFELEEFKDRKVKELSKGNQQKIQFITAIIHDPEIIILDEPFSGLDPLNVHLFKNEITKLKEEGKIIIFSSHRFDHIENFCEDIIFLMHGKDVINGKVSELKKQASQFVVTIKAQGLNVSDIEAIEGVSKVEELVDRLKVEINNYDVNDKLFEIVKNSEKLEEYSIDLPSLEELIIQKVGESNGK